MKKRQPAFFTAIRLLIMQLCVLCIFCNTVYANAQAVLDKKVNLTVDQVELKKVLREIKKQTGIEFSYSSDVINVTKKVTCRLSDKKLSDFLTSVLKPLGISYNIIDDSQILLYNTAKKEEDEKNGQEEKESYYSPPPPIKITGSVSNEKGLPMSGVTVVVRGVGTTTATGDDGGAAG